MTLGKIHVMQDATGRVTGEAFVEVFSEEDVSEAMKQHKVLV